MPIGSLVEHPEYLLVRPLRVVLLEHVQVVGKLDRARRALGEVLEQIDDPGQRRVLPHGFAVRRGTGRPFAVERGPLRAEPPGQAAVAAGLDFLPAPREQQVLHGAVRIEVAVLADADAFGVVDGIGAERLVQARPVFPHQLVPGVGVRILEVGVPDVVGVDEDRPLTGVHTAVRGPGAAIQVQPGTVVAQPVDLHPVVVDHPPPHIEELVRQVRAAR